MHYFSIDKIKYLMNRTIICIEDVQWLKYNLSEPDDDRFRSKHVVQH
jgi:hypothetical protein